MTITLTLNAKTLSEGQTISGSSFVNSVADSAHRSITQYSVYDSGADGGYFILNGVEAFEWRVAHRDRCAIRPAPVRRRQ